MLRLIVLGLLFTLKIFAASAPEELKLPADFRFMRYATIQGKTSDDLILARSERFTTTAIFHKEGIWPGWSRGLVILVPGTSGNVTSEYGIENSMGMLARTIVKDYKRSVLVLTPPIYWHAEDPYKRRPVIEKYSALEPHMVWLNKIFGFARSEAPLDMEKKPRLPMYYIGRSTGAAYGAEALDRFLRGDPEHKFTTMRWVKRMLLIGLEGHSRIDIDRWHNAELDYYTAHPEKGDFDVIRAAPKFFKDMFWQKFFLHEEDWLPPFAPGIVAMAGARDEFTDLAYQLPAARDLAKKHPGVEVELLLHDWLHSPTAIPKDYVPRKGWTSKEKDRSPMSRMHFGLRKLFAGDADFPMSAGRPRGLSVDFVPTRGMVEEAIGADRLEICLQILQQDATLEALFDGI